MAQIAQFRVLILAIGAPMGMFMAIAAASWFKRLSRKLMSRAGEGTRKQPSTRQPVSIRRRRRGDRLVNEAARHPVVAFA